MLTLFRSKKEQRNLVTAVGLLALYSVGVTTYIFTFSPKLRLLGSNEQKALQRSIHLESTLRKVAGFADETAEFSVVLRRDASHPDHTNVFVQRTTSQYPFARIGNVHTDHYHPAELQDGSLFVIRRLSDPDGIWQDSQGSILGYRDELWRYEISGEGTALYAQPGLDFRVSPNAKHIGLTEGTAKLMIIESEGSKRTSLRWPELAGELRSAFQKRIEESQSPPDVTLLGWSLDSKYVWGWIGWETPQAIFRLNIANNAVRQFDVSNVNLTSSFSLEKENGYLAYSTHKGDLRIVKLLLDETIDIASSDTPFYPKWIGSETLEYTHPYTKERTLYQL